MVPILELISEFTTAVFSSPSIIVVIILASLLITLITDSPAGSGMVHDLPVLSILLGLSGVISAAPPCPALPRIANSWLDSSRKLAYNAASMVIESSTFISIICKRVSPLCSLILIGPNGDARPCCAVTSRVPSQFGIE